MNARCFTLEELDLIRSLTASEALQVFGIGPKAWQALQSNGTNIDGLTYPTDGVEVIVLVFEGRPAGTMGRKQQRTVPSAMPYRAGNGKGRSN
jgi:hypothetical protein